MRVKFTADACIIREGVEVVLFKAGKTADLPDASGDRWIRRNVAIDLDADKKAAAAAERRAAKDKVDDAHAKAAAPRIAKRASKKAKKKAKKKARRK